LLQDESQEETNAMRQVFGLIRIAAIAALTLGAAALTAPAPAEAQNRHGWSGGHVRYNTPRVHRQAYRQAHRPLVRHAGPRHYAPRRVVRHVNYGPRRVAYRHYAPRRVVHRQYAPRYVYHRPRARAVFYAAPVYYSPRRCVIKKRWVHTYYGPQLVKQRVCRHRW
jgi:hypothetical protein